MKSIVITSLCLVLVGFVSNPLLRAAETQAVKDATDEAVRRESYRKELTQKLADGITAENRGAFLEAARHYTDCLELVRKIGSPNGIETQYKAALSGFVATRTILADQAQRAGDFPGAETQYALILKEDPKNDAVMKLRAGNEQKRAAMAGRMPDEATIAQLPGFYTNRVASATLAQNGKALFEAGKYDMAEAKLRQALKLDPDNQGADYYLKLTVDRKASIASNQEEMTQREKILGVIKTWPDSTSRESLPVPNPYTRTNYVKTGQGRQRISHKLDAIKLDSVAYDGLPLSEVIKAIDKDAINRDPDKKGINFLLSTTADPQQSAAQVIDPATGLPVAGGAGGGGGEGDIGTTTIRISPPQKDISLHQLLDILVLVADRPIKYTVTDFGVVITLKGQEAQTLYTRWYKIDPNTFMNGLQGVVSLDFGGGGGGGGQGGGGGGGGRGGGGGGGRGGGGGGGGGRGGQGGQNSGGQGGGQQGGSAQYASVSVAGAGAGRAGQGGAQQPGGARGGAPGGAAGGQGGGIEYTTVQTSQDVAITMVKNYFTTAGVDLTVPPKSVVFNDRLGMLMVRATLTDLEIIEQAVQVLNMIPPQVYISTKIAEVGQDDTKALGFDWLWGNTLIAGGRIGAQGGTAPSYNGRPSAGNPSGVFPGPLPAGSPIGSIVPGTAIPAATDNVLTSSLRNSAPALATISGILTDPQFRVVIRALEQRQGVSFIATPSVLTPSGRQAQIKTVEVRAIVTDLSLDQTAGGGGGNAITGNTGGGGGVGSLIQPISEPFELGPSLDVIPYVSADGYTIQLTLIPTLKEFVGYDLDSARIFSAQIQSVSGNSAAPPIVQPVPLPIFRLRQVVTSAIVWDGQTVALGGLIADETTKIKDKVPVFGDLPFIGRLFRSESSVTKKKNLVIFVTPTIIDPAGNRVHTDDEMPFAQGAFPAQKTVTQ